MKWCIVFILALMPVTGQSKENFKDLHRKTVQGFIVPYTLRYDPDQWSCVYIEDGNRFSSSTNSRLKITVTANKSEKNLTREALETGFQGAIKNAHADPERYHGYDIKPSTLIEINGISFLYQSAIIHLAPNSVHIRDLGGKLGLQKRYISDKGTIDQVDYYIYSSDAGSIYFRLESEGELTSADQTAIDELFRGFSFDGSACRGPAKLRGIKTFLEVLTNQ